MNKFYLVLVINLEKENNRSAHLLTVKDVKDIDNEIKKITEGLYVIEQVTLIGFGEDIYNVMPEEVQKYFLLFRDERIGIAMSGETFSDFEMILSTFLQDKYIAHPRELTFVF